MAQGVSEPIERGTILQALRLEAKNSGSQCSTDGSRKAGELRERWQALVDCELRSPSMANTGHKNLICLIIS
jgi:hypothetical protein